MPFLNFRAESKTRLSRLLGVDSSQPVVRPSQTRREHRPPRDTAASPSFWEPVLLTARTDYETYTGNVYGNGLQNAATETSVTIKIASGINSGAVLPTASGDRKPILARQEDHSGTTYWTAYPPLLASGGA
jgi:hypothetical protein